MGRRTKVEEKQKYAVWYKTPPEFRNPLTRGMICEQLGVSVSRAKVWEKEIDAVAETATDEDFAEFMEFLRMKAFHIQGANKDRELYAKLKGWMIEKREDRITFDFKPSDRIRIGKEILAGLREQYKLHGGICPLCSRSQVLLDEVRLDSDEGEATQES